MTRQDSRGTQTLDVFSSPLTDRIVYLGTGIDDGVANVLIAQLLHLQAVNPDAPIDLYINSPGGAIPAMLAVYDAMHPSSRCAPADGRRPRPSPPP
ncbi:ClpP family protease [Tersicoccus phoenicis]|uniref:ClpP family protease n=1 Tax=Tersicoccus phoenicis TaxID=554083 RepID=UPI002E260BDD